MKVADIADEIYSENGEPGDTSVSAISYWVRNMIGGLNSLIYASYHIDAQTFEIKDENENEIDINAVAIIKKKWKVERYDYLIRAKLSSIDSDDIEEIWDDGSKIKTVNRSELIKSLKGLKELEKGELDMLINSYRISGAGPRQVAGDDTEIGII